MIKHEKRFIGNYTYEDACKLADEKSEKVTKTWDSWGQTIWIVTWYIKEGENER